ncbi:MAG: tetratricopeptide repeat protein [Phycisphaerae bacterium]|jgi:tetratricopeptide (TPR) repeat protein|nr:tetratricopeptide repeat protein [Phycisphaerae bacterium]MCZ2399801.1 tetratricopeptide repeat protein [Phycisphaerae bacterium]
MTRIDQLQRLIALDPSDPLAHYSLGLEYLNQQRPADAIAAFDAAVAADANYSAAFYHKARALLMAGRAADALETLKSGQAVARAAGDWHAAGEMQSLAESIA